MKYITGIHALNLDCKLNTSGDWHTSAIQWERPKIRESNESIFKDYGLEYNCDIPESTKKYTKANHIRACLDLLELGEFGYLGGMRRDYMCTDEYDKEIFDKVLMLKNIKHWDNIDKFMEKEYMLKWLKYT